MKYYFIPYDDTDTIPASLDRIVNVLKGIFYLEYAILTIGLNIYIKITLNIHFQKLKCTHWKQDE